MSAIPALSLAEITERGIDPALALLPCKLDSPEARVLLLAIGLQESRFMYRRQIVDGQAIGPAKSFWQAEQGGGMVRGVRTHPATSAMAAVLLEARQVRRTDAAVWNAIENDDILAAGLARLLLYSDPYPLPALGDVDRAWKLYAERTWRPGKPHRVTWAGFYTRALNFVREQDE